MHKVISLTRDECELLLQGAAIGRAAIDTAHGPHIVPVNYSVVDGAVFIRTTATSVLGKYLHQGPRAMAFEVDSIDDYDQLGWQVLVRGEATWVADPEVLKRLRVTWPPQPWAPGIRLLHVRLPMTELSGLRVSGGFDTKRVPDSPSP